RRMDHRAGVADRQVGPRRLLAGRGRGARPRAVAARGGGVAVRAAAARVDHGDRADARRRRHARAAHARPASARLGAVQPAPDALRGPAPGRGRARGAGTAARRRALMRWWGWGEDGAAVPLSPAGEDLLRDELGADPATRRPPVPCDQVKLPDPALPAQLKERLAKTLGAEQVRDDRETRVAHAVERSYPDLVRIRAGDASSAPDAVAFPASAELIAAVLGLCAEHRVAVVPFGGGTSVVGGVEPVREGFAGV